jgi:cell division protein FtsI/penicillin-binding protein 2
MGNPAVSSPFEPGSVNKIVTAATAIEMGLTNPDEVLSVPGVDRDGRRHVCVTPGATASTVHHHRVCSVSPPMSAR